MNKDLKRKKEAYKLCSDFYKWILGTGRTSATVSSYQEKRELLHQANKEKYPSLTNREAFIIRSTINSGAFNKLKMNGYIRKSNGKIETVYSLVYERR